MSTYVEIAGQVRMDRKAFEAFAQSPAGSWLLPCTDRASGPPSGLLQATTGADNTIVVQPSSGAIRNLGRYLASGIIDAACAGWSRGAFEVLCSDGSTYREVIVIRDDGPLIGVTGCLNGEVELGIPSALPLPGTDLVLIRAETTTGTRVGVHSFDKSCSCGGWEDDEGALCATANPQVDASIYPYADDDNSDGTGIQDLISQWIDLADGAGAFGLGRFCANGCAQDPTWRKLLGRWAERYPTVKSGHVEVEICPTYDKYDASKLTHRPYPWATGGGLYLTRPGGSDGIPAELADRVLRAAVTLHHDGLIAADALAAAVSVVVT